MSIDPGSDRSVFKQIADHLRNEIASGRWAPGDKLPSESELCEQFGVTRRTVREALNVLRHEGRIVSYHGRGVFVREQPLVVRVGTDRLSRAHRAGGRAAFQAEMESSGLSWRAEIRELAEVAVPDHVAPWLNLEPGEPAFVRRRRMWGNDVPLQLADSYYRADLVRGTRITQEDTGPGGAYSRLEELGNAV